MSYPLIWHHFYVYQVEEAYIQCTDDERDEVLYYLLAK